MLEFIYFKLLSSGPWVLQRNSDLFIFDEDAPTDILWFAVEKPFSLKPLQYFPFFEITGVGLYQNPFALFLFSNYYVAKVSESSRPKTPWMSSLSKSKCTLSLSSTSTLASLLQPKMAAVWGKRQEKMWQSLSENQMKNTLFQVKISITYIYFTTFPFVWLS